MKLLQKINLALLIVLSISTGLVKLASMEAEMVIFRNAGWSDDLIYLFGIIQSTGGFLLIPNNTRKIGGYLMAPTFLIATIILFVNNMIPFGIFSILFILMATWTIIKPIQFVNHKF